MPRSCTICTHPQREAIDAALAVGEPNRRIAAQYGLSEASVRRHKAEHLPAHLTQAQQAQDVAQADDLLAQLEALRRDAGRIGAKAERVSEFSPALLACREQARIIELLLKVAGELAEGPTVNILVSPEWVALRTVLLQALGPYPEARAAAARALLEAGDGHEG